MIKINLLPRTINQKAVIRNTAIAFAVVLVAIIVGGLVFASNLDKQISDRETAAQAAETWQKRVEDLQKQASDQKSSITPIKNKLDFINAVLKFNGVYPKLYSEVARWTYDKVMYTAIACDGTQLVIAARTKNLDYLGRYLLNMYRATDLFTEVTISGVPGYGQGAQTGAPSFDPNAPITSAVTSINPSDTSGGQSSLAGIQAISSSMQKSPEEKGWVNFVVVCKLKTPIAAPSFGAGSTAGGAAGAPGAAAPAAAPAPAAPAP